MSHTRPGLVTLDAQSVLYVRNYVSDACDAEISRSWRFLSHLADWDVCGPTDVVKVRMQLQSMQLAGNGRLIAPNLVRC